MERIVSNERGVERVCVFIDGSNFYHALRNAKLPYNLDFHKLGLGLCNKSQKLIRVYYYNSPLPTGDPNYEAQQRFLSAVKRMPYVELRLGRLEPRRVFIDPKKIQDLKLKKDLGILLNDLKLKGIEYETKVEKGVDIKLASDMIGFAYNNTYDTSILVSGDGDFADAVKTVKNMGKHVINAFINKPEIGVKPSYHLLGVCDDRIFITEELLQKCIYNPPQI